MSDTDARDWNDDQSQSVNAVDVAVVGAGLAGLTAARTLKQDGQSVVVLEASSRVGGRIVNQESEGGVVVEGGAAWISSRQPRISTLASELGLKTFPTYNDGQNILFRHGNATRYRSGVPPVGALARIDLAQAMLRLNRMADRVDVEEPWNTPGAEDLDSRTFGRWLARNTVTVDARFVFQTIIGAAFGGRPQDVSLLHVLYHIQTAGSLLKLIGIRRGAFEQRFVGGSEVLPRRIAGELGDAVRLAEPVTRVQQRDSDVVVTTPSQRYSARRVIIAIDPAATRKIRFEPGLPLMRNVLSERWVYSKVLKVHAIYERPFWREEGLTGQVVSDTGPVRWSIDASPPDGSSGALAAFIGLATGDPRLFAPDQNERRRQAVLESLASYFGENALHPVDFLEKDWSAHPWISGYEPNLPTGLLTGQGPALRAPIGMIHWAGSETATAWEGHMEGAIQSGERAAQEVLDSL